MLHDDISNDTRTSLGNTSSHLVGDDYVSYIYQLGLRVVLIVMVGKQTVVSSLVPFLTFLLELIG